MRNGLLLLAGLALAGCSMEMPQFLGREGGGQGMYNVRGEPPPEPVRMAFREATLERGLRGVIVRVEGLAPADGYWGAALVPLNGGRADAAGVVTFEFMAIPPPAPGGVSPPRARTLTAGTFLPAPTLKTVRAVRISGSGGVQTFPLG